MADFTTAAIFHTRGENSHFPVSKQMVKVQLSLHSKKVWLKKPEFRLFQPEKMLRRVILVSPVKNVRNSIKHFSVVLIFYSS